MGSNPPTASDLNNKHLTHSDWEAEAYKSIPVGSDGSSMVKENTHTGNYELLVNLEGHVCAENTTNTPLDADATFTGDWQDALDYASIIIGIITDQNSATDGLVIEWSSNGTDIIQDDKFSITADRGKVFTFTPANRYFRVKYTNGSVAQGSFDLQSVLKKVGVKGSSHRISDSIVADDDAELVKAVVTGENPANGTQLDIFNRNRNSDNDDFLAVYYGATVSGNGTTSNNYFEININYYVHPGI